MLKLVLGCVGAGKSSFINRMNGDTSSNVSDDQFEDGTTSWQRFGEFIDTPGLDSNNMKWGTIRDKIKSYGEQFIILLVLDAHMDRASVTLREKFQRILGEFNDQKFYIVWTKTSPRESKRLNWEQKFAGKLLHQFYETDDPNYRPDFSVCSPVRLKPLALPLGSAAPVKSEVVVEPAEQVAQRTDRLVSLPPFQLYGIVKNFSIFQKFCRAHPPSKTLPPEALRSICKKVVKTADEEVHRMRVIGDCVLKFIVCVMILEKGLKPVELSRFIEPIIKNKGGFMERFVHDHFTPLLDFSFDSDHEAADCFEAVLAYAVLGDKKLRKSLIPVLFLMIDEIGLAVAALRSS